MLSTQLRDITSARHAFATMDSWSPDRSAPACFTLEPIGFGLDVRFAVRGLSAIGLAEPGRLWRRASDLPSVWRLGPTSSDDDQIRLALKPETGRDGRELVVGSVLPSITDDPPTPLSLAASLLVAEIRAFEPRLVGQPLELLVMFHLDLGPLDQMVLPFVAREDEPPKEPK